MNNENRRLAIAATSGVLATIAVVGGVIGLSALRGDSDPQAVSTSTAPLVADSGLLITLSPGTLSMSGSVASDSDLSRLRASATAARPAATTTAVTSSRTAGAPTPAAVDYLERLIPSATKRLLDASITATGGAIRVTGEARTLSGKRTLARSFEAASASGLQISRSITLSPRLRYLERAQNELQAVVGREGIHFGPKRDRLTPQGRAAIDRALIVIRRYPTLHYRVSGYSDSRGTRQANHDLSHERADAVVKRLLEAGIPKRNLEDEGYGAVRPLGDNASPTGHLRNNRVEIDVEG